MSTNNQAMLRAISGDRALASSMLFSHRHPHETPPFHVEMLDLWRCADEFVLIEAFREGAKSTLAEEFLLVEACFGNFPYAVIFGETYTKACQRIEAIAYEVMTNEKLRAIFGRVLEKKPTENKIHFKQGVLIEGVGWEQEITGFKHLDHRPWRALLDDVENLERVRDSDAVTATVRKLYREVLPAMDKIHRKIRVTETPRAADCLVTRLRNDPQWICRSFPICDGDIDDPGTKSAWPARYPMAWIRAERDRFAAQGMLREFKQEYLLSVEGRESKPFEESMIAYSDMAPASWLPRAAIYDPSRSANELTSARTGKVVVSQLGSKIIVHESGGHFWRPDELRDDLFTTNAKHHPFTVAVEKNSLDEYLMQPIRAEMLKRGEALPIEALQAPQDRDKDRFIMGLHPFFKARDVVLVGGKLAHPVLVAEITNFPGGKKDVLNALAYALKIFAGVAVYQEFSDKHIMPAWTPAGGETVHACWNSDGSITVCAALVRQGRHYCVARVWDHAGAPKDAARWIGVELRAEYPRNPITTWAPAELHEQWQRIALVPALRELRFSPFRADHVTPARAALAEKLRTTIRNRPLLTVDPGAHAAIAALAGGYKFPIGATGQTIPDPKSGVSKLVAEALETAVSVLEKGAGDGQAAVNNATTPTGVAYRSAMPGTGRRI